MASRQLDQLKALEVRGTWRFVRAQSASFWLLCFYLVLEYLRPQNMWPVLDVLPWGQTTIILCTLALLSEGRKLGLPTVAGSTLLFFTAVLLLSCVFAFSPAVAFANLELYLVWLLVILLIVNIVRNESRFVVFMLLFLLLSFKMSQHAFRSFVMAGGRFVTHGATGAPGWFHNSGEFGIQLCIFFPLSVAFLWSLRHRWPLWKQAAVACMPASALVAVVATSSRGALVGIAFVGLWWWVAVNRRNRMKGLAIMVVLGVATWTIMPEGAKERFSRSGEDQTSTHRLDLWKFGIEMANSRPVLGVGYGNWEVYYRENFPRLSRDSLLPHNIFVQAGAELGYTGILAFLMMIGAKFKVNAKTRRLAQATPGDHGFSYAMAFGLDGAMVGYLASGFFVTVFFYPYFWFNLAMTIALNRAMVRTAREVRRSSPPVQVPDPRRAVVGPTLY